ncbi:MAG TPA: phosphoribosyltransferase family protein [Gaiellaceae bacterium]|nr:phosphoribosyltransferase family protein [Gaiellaceae bacterium]
MSDEREVMTWDELGEGARDLAERIHADGYEPDVILAIARCGLLVAGALGYALGVKNTYTMNVEFYTGVDERLSSPMILPPVPELVDLAEAKLLIADDVATRAERSRWCGTSAPERWTRFAPPSSMRSRPRWWRATTSGARRRPGSPFPGAHCRPSRKSSPSPGAP